MCENKDGCFFKSCCNSFSNCFEIQIRTHYPYFFVCKLMKVKRLNFFPHFSPSLSHTQIFHKADGTCSCNLKRPKGGNLSKSIYLSWCLCVARLIRVFAAFWFNKRMINEWVLSGFTHTGLNFNKTRFKSHHFKFFTSPTNRKKIELCSYGKVS